MGAAHGRFQSRAPKFFNEMSSAVSPFRWDESLGQIATDSSVHQRQSSIGWVKAFCDYVAEGFSVCEDEAPRIFLRTTKSPMK